MGAQKIAIFTHGIRRGPFARLATTLAKGFAKLGVDCEVVVLNATEEEKSRYPEVKVHSLNAPKATFSLIPLIKYLKTAQPDVVFSMPWYFNVVAIWAKKLAKVNTKIIIGEHNIFSLESKIEHGNKPQIKLLVNARFLSLQPGTGCSLPRHNH
jgi:hypothetical protein